MENAYDTLSLAITELNKEGYEIDFNLCAAGVEDKNRKKTYNPSDLNVIRYYRFEGMSNPDDNTILYVIETTNGDKGLLVDAYGMYSGNVPKEMTDKLRMKG
jgi:hypothetical protein